MSAWVAVAFLALYLMTQVGITRTRAEVGSPVHDLRFAFGVLVTAFLMTMRTRFLWWPFHPAGHAVSSSYAMRGWWAMFFLGWALKSVILKHGGVRALRQATPFFMGMILGEFVVGGFWAMFGIITGTRGWSLVM